MPFLPASDNRFTHEIRSHLSPCLVKVAQSSDLSWEGRGKGGNLEAKIIYFQSSKVMSSLYFGLDGVCLFEARTSSNSATPLRMEKKNNDDITLLI
jgi:hypothetical protein